MASNDVQGDFVIEISAPPQAFLASENGSAGRALLTGAAVLPGSPGMSELRPLISESSAPLSTTTPDDSVSDAGAALTPSTTNGQDELNGLSSTTTSTQTWTTQLKFAFSFGSSADESAKSKDDSVSDKFEYITVEDFPKGYPKYAAFMASDDTFLNVPAHLLTGCRLMLHLNNDLNEIEKKLRKLDNADAKDPYLQARLRGSKEHDRRGEQGQLINDLKDKFMDYTSVVLRVAEMKRLGPAPERNHRSTHTWVEKHKPFSQEIREFVKKQEDFVNLADHGKKERRMKNFVEGFLDNSPDWKLIRFLRYLLQNKRTAAKADDTYVTRYGDMELEIFTNVAFVSLATATLLLAMCILVLVPMGRATLVVSGTVFVALYTALVCTFTGAKAHENYLALAAFAAVVFMALENPPKN